MQNTEINLIANIYNDTHNEKDNLCNTEQMINSDGMEILTRK